MSQRSNTNRRARLHKEQGGVCFYCLRPIGYLVGSLLNPALEHYQPRALGGRQLVLACGWCDKTKGMMNGAAFKAVLDKYVEHYGYFNDLSMVAIKKECNAINVRLHQTHQPNIIGKQKTLERQKKIEASRGVTITEVPPVLSTYIRAGDTGREQHIADWQARWAQPEGWKGRRPTAKGDVPHTGDRHYQAWTGKNPA